MIQDVPHASVLGTRVDALPLSSFREQIISLANAMASGYICHCNVHMVMEARKNRGFQRVVNNATLVTPDGVPIVWAIRRMGFPLAHRVSGPDLMMALLGDAERKGLSVGFVGSTPEVLAALEARLRGLFPHLIIGYIHSPPFRPLTDSENQAVLQQLRERQVRLLFVSLGCPKQEQWIARHSAQLKGVMLGVGAAFAFLSEQAPRAPKWIQKLGLEWFHRFMAEPRRLWRRYFLYGPLFFGLLFRQLVSKGAKP